MDELNEVVDALRALKDVEIVRIKNRFREDPTPSGYRDVNVNLVYHGLVVELQIHLAEVLRVADRQHVAYEAARELDLMGVLEKPDFASLSETAAPAATTAKKTHAGPPTQVQDRTGHADFGAGINAIEIHTVTASARRRGVVHEGPRHLTHCVISTQAIHESH